jgi:hypothetical protein
LVRGFRNSGCRVQDAARASKDASTHHPSNRLEYVSNMEYVRLLPACASFASCISAASP